MSTLDWATESHSHSAGSLGNFAVRYAERLPVVSLTWPAEAHTNFLMSLDMHLFERLAREFLRYLAYENSGHGL